MATEVATEPVTTDPVRAEPAPRPRSPAGSVRRTRSALVALVVVLLFGAYSRLVDLGDTDLWSDELMHVWAAQSLERGDGPRLPSGELYTRGMDLTRLVRVTSRYVSDPEAAARLPSAIFGIAGLVAFAAIVWRVGGRWPAVWATLLLAVFPVTLQEARNTRFYTLQLLHGLVAFYAGWRALEPRPRHDETEHPDATNLNWLASRWGWVALALAAFATAARIQLTTVSIFAGWGVAALIFAMGDVYRYGRRSLRESVPLQLVIAGLVGLALAVVVAPSAIRKVIAFAVDVPLWAETEYSPRAYYWLLSNTVPVVLSLIPLLFLAVARRNLALAVYLFTLFAVPMVLHSVVLKFQADRYVLLALPPLFMAAGIAASDACGALLRAVTAEVRRASARISPRVAEYAGVAIVAAVVATALMTTPAFSKSTQVTTRAIDVRPRTDWKRALEVLRSTPGADTLPWGSLQHLAARFYWPRIDFTIERGMLDRPVGGPDTPGVREIVVHPEGTRDFYVGVPVLWRASAVRQYYGAGRDVIVAMDSTVEAFYAGGVVNELRRGVATELCHGQCGTIKLYRWTLTEETGEPNR